MTGLAHKPIFGDSADRDLLRLRRDFDGLQRSLGAEEWKTLALDPPWLGFAAGVLTGPEFRKDRAGTVHIRGWAHTNSISVASSDLIGTLPVGYRPGTYEGFLALTTTATVNGQGRIDITTAGHIYLMSFFTSSELLPTNVAALSLSGISFVAGN